LKLKLLPEEKKAIERRGTDNVEAYNLYLMARQYFLEGNVGDSRREEAILRLTRRATEIDPAYARAWALMALAQWSLRYNRGKTSDDGLAAAEQALTLDPALAEPHAVRAQILASQGRADEAFTELDVALRLDPDSDAVNRTAGLLNLRANKLQEAIRHFEKAAALQETDFGSCGMLITCYSAAGDADGVRRAAQMTLARSEKVVAQDPNNAHAMAFGVSALVPLGEVDRAKEWIKRAMLIDPDNLMVRYNFACALSNYLEEADAALEMLEPVFANISPGMLNAAETDPDLDPIRGDPRYQAMVAAAEARLAAAI
jgi:adenylate cyclase